MFDSFIIGVVDALDGTPLWVSDYDLEGNATLSSAINRASRFDSFKKASRIGSLIDYPCVFVIGVIINE